MSKTVLTGRQVKELLGQAVGGIYFENNYDTVITDIISEYSVTDEGFRADFENFLTLNIPISDGEEFTNYAIKGEDEELIEIWEDSTYFEYKFVIARYTLCFNLTDKGTVLTWKQFKELANSKDYGIFEIYSADGGSLYIEVANCTVEVNGAEIEMNSQGVNATFDESIIDAIYNDSIESGSVRYRFEFNNGMSDLLIEPVQRVRKFYKK